MIPRNIFPSTGASLSNLFIFCRFNESQLKAISAGVKNIGITAIQGPPGTGNRLRNRIYEEDLKLVQ